MSKTLRGTNGQVIFLKTARKILTRAGWKQHKKTLTWAHPLETGQHTINQAWAKHQGQEQADE